MRKKFHKFFESARKTIKLLTFCSLATLLSKRVQVCGNSSHDTLWYVSRLSIPPGKESLWTAIAAGSGYSARFLNASNFRIFYIANN